MNDDALPARAEGTDASGTEPVGAEASTTQSTGTAARPARRPRAPSTRPRARRPRAAAAPDAEAADTQAAGEIVATGDAELAPTAEELPDEVIPDQEPATEPRAAARVVHPDERQVLEAGEPIPLLRRDAHLAAGSGGGVDGAALVDAVLV